VTADRLDPAVIAEWARRSRASQSLPAQIMDPTVLARVVTLAFAGTDPLASNGAHPVQSSRTRVARKRGKADDP
jgi:hypothetical protein